MAIVKAAFQITGRLDGLCYYVNKFGQNIVRMPGGPSKRQIKRAESFALTRRNNQEFSNASKTSAQVKNALKRTLNKSYDGRMNNRMMSVIRRMAQTDRSAQLGDKKAWRGDTTLLEGFQWNADRPTDLVFQVDMGGYLDRETRRGHILVAGFDTLRDIRPPEGATHFEVIGLLSGCCSRLERNDSEHCEQSGGVHELGKRLSGPLEMNFELPEADYLFLILGAGIRFYQDRGGELPVLIREISFTILKAA